MKTLKVLLATAILTLTPAHASAGDYEVANVMDDALYGAGVGALVGLGAMLLTDQPTNNWSYVSRGLGLGIIAGAAYGMYRSSKSFAQVEDGQIHLGIPTPEIAFKNTPSGLDMVLTTKLIGGRF
ncbi:MAG: hypothetical protein Q9N67_00585 [Ghiorsea sp.]|nr:hypothetical protein [Ghiorsea sp.]